MTRPTRPPGPPPDDFPEDDSNGRPRRDPRSPGDPYQQGPRPTFTPHGVPSAAPARARMPAQPTFTPRPDSDWQRPDSDWPPLDSDDGLRGRHEGRPGDGRDADRRRGDRQHGDRQHAEGRPEDWWRGDTPRDDGPRADVPARSAGPRGDGRPQPTFTPREGYLPPPPDAGRQDVYPPPTTAFFAPPGYPQPSFTPYPYGEARPRRREPRPGRPDERPPRGRPGGPGDGRTQVLDAPGPREPGGVSGTGPQRGVGTQTDLARSSKAMALGTIASRGTGFLRTFGLAAALGSGKLADAYNISNTLPNTVYYLMLGGIFTSVVVPLLVQAAKNHPDKGEAYAERIFTLGATALLIITVAGTALSVPIVDLYLRGATASEHRLAVIFAYFFIPQIFFYGMDSLLGAILNTKGRFGANMWTPVINNVVVITVFGLFLAVQGPGRTPSNISSFGVNLLGVGTTLGIVIQSIALFPIVKRAGFSFRLRFDFRRSELSEIGSMAGWMLGYVISQFAANLVLTVVASIASSRHGATTGTGYSAFAYANQLFQLPYAIVGISVISALLPRMSGHATDRRYSLVRADFSTGVRLASVIVVPAAVFLGVLGAPLCELLFAHESLTVSEARYIGEVFGTLSLGLVPFMVTQLQLRVFYSFHDNRTPGIIGFAMLVVGVIGDCIALNVLPPSQVVVGLGAVYGLVTVVGAAIAWPLLMRHVGHLDGWRITRSLVRMFLATIPGLVWALVVMAVAGSALRQGTFYGLASVIIGGGGAVLLYAFFARVLRIDEFQVLMRTVASRFGR
jgi:murein biosynthesis integral membrane protein MurJ